MPTTQPAVVLGDVEVRIFNRQGDGYAIELTLGHAQQYEGGVLAADFVDQWRTSADPDEDGRRLFDWLYAAPAFQRAWNEIRGRFPLRRVRLRIDPDAPELHRLPWELLCESQPLKSPQRLAASTATPFSRYLAGEWHPGAVVRQRPIRVLVAMANPANLSARYHLPPIDVEAEWAALSAATADLDVELIRLAQPCTLAALEEALREDIHVLHILAHGLFNQETDEAALLLADAENQGEIVREETIAQMLAHHLAMQRGNATDALRLVFLAACDSAKRSQADAFRGLAPRLIQAGVPAVVAMQDRVSMETARTFAATFYRQLLSHGMVDLACNQARSTLFTQELPGTAVPVLFMRLRDGCLFEGEEEADWEDLLVQSGQVINPGWHPLGTLLTAAAALTAIGLFVLAGVFLENSGVAPTLRIAGWLALAATLGILLVSTGLRFRRRLYPTQRLTHRIGQTRRWQIALSAFVGLGLLIDAGFGWHQLRVARECAPYANPVKEMTVAVVARDDIMQDAKVLAILLSKHHQISASGVDNDLYRLCRSFFEYGARLNKFEGGASPWTYVVDVENAHTNRHIDSDSKSTREKCDLSTLQFLSNDVIAILPTENPLFLNELDLRFPPMNDCLLYEQNEIAYGYLVNDNFAAAVAILEDVVNTEPTYAVAHNNLGRAFSGLERYAEAGPHYQSAIDLLASANGKSWSRFQRNLGLNHFYLRQYDDAERELRAALDSHVTPGDEGIRAQVYADLAMVYRAQALWTEAADALAQANKQLASSPDNHNVRVARAAVAMQTGLLAYAQGDYNEALVHLPKALEHTDEQEELYFYLSHSYQLSGQTDVACEFWATYLSLDFEQTHLFGESERRLLAVQYRDEAKCDP